MGGQPLLVLHVGRGLLLLLGLLLLHLSVHLLLLHLAMLVRQKVQRRLLLLLLPVEMLLLLMWRRCEWVLLVVSWLVPSLVG